MTLPTNTTTSQHITQPQSTQLTMSNGTNPQASQPPLPQTAAFANNLKLRTMNKSYLLANNLVPRRPAYSTSKVEVNMNSNQRECFDRANFYLKYDPPIHQGRFSDQTRMKTGNYVKNQNNNLVKTNHFNSIESIPSNVNAGQKNSRMKILKFFQVRNLNHSKKNIEHFPTKKKPFF